MKKRRLEEKLLDEIRRTENISSACDRVGLSRQSFYRWMKSDPDFAEKVEEAMEMGNLSLCDLAQSKLITNMNKGDQRAIEFHLKNRDPRYKPKKPTVSDEVKFIPITNIYHDSLDEKSNKKIDDIEL